MKTALQVLVEMLRSRADNLNLSFLTARASVTIAPLASQRGAGLTPEAVQQSDVRVPVNAAETSFGFLQETQRRDACALGSDAVQPLAFDKGHQLIEV